MKYTIYTDGACKGNPGPGAWAFVVLRDGEKIYEGVSSLKSTTNNRMELLAAIRGLQCVRDAIPDIDTSRIVVYSDSKYLVRGVSEWMNNWERQGWAKSDGSPVKNLDLWQELKRLIDALQPHFEWVRGHNGDEWNEHCDYLATQALK